MQLDLANDFSFPDAAADGLSIMVPAGIHKLESIPNPRGHEEPWLVVSIDGKKAGMAARIMRIRFKIID